jgi:hypothetical protein
MLLNKGLPWRLGSQAGVKNEVRFFWKWSGGVQPFLAEWAIYNKEWSLACRMKAKDYQTDDI